MHGVYWLYFSMLVSNKMFSESPLEMDTSISEMDCYAQNKPAYDFVNILND